MSGPGSWRSGSNNPPPNTNNHMRGGPFQNRNRCLPCYPPPNVQSTPWRANTDPRSAGPDLTPIPPPPTRTIAGAADARDTGPFINWGEGYPQSREDLKVGTQISIKHHVQRRDGLTEFVTPYETLTQRGGWVYSKSRKFVIIACYNSHYIALPIFTYGGHGLTYKPAAAKREYVGIRDAELVKTAPGVQSLIGVSNIIIRRLVNTNEYLHERHLTIAESAFLCWTSPFSFSYSDKCYIEGHVEEQEDLERLVKIYYSDARTVVRNDVAFSPPSPVMSSMGWFD